jgi:hypothetical protein
MLVLWRDNFSLDSEKLEEVICQLKTRPDCRQWVENNYSSYYVEDLFDRPEIVFAEDYIPVIHKFMKHINLFKTTNFRFNHWMQLYTNEQSGHKTHDHFSYQTFFSWVHFVRPTKNKCFYFLGHEGEKVYPEQNPGDFIVFPSWAWHGVDQNTEDSERVSIAGNIVVEKIKSDAYTCEWIGASDKTNIIEITK